MIFSFEALRKSMIFQSETRTRNVALRNSKFHRFLVHFRTQNRPENRCGTEPVSRRYMETARNSAETNVPHDFWTTNLATHIIRSTLSIYLSIY